MNTEPETWADIPFNETLAVEKAFGASVKNQYLARVAMNTEHAWLDLVPPRGATPTELGPDSGPGDAITVTPDELKRLNAIDGIHWTHLPVKPDDTRQYACRILGPQRVAVILQNSERGLGTPVVVES